ncbi:ribonuclease domain-containing protein [Yimella sp. cx-51]|uniref:ribonuclease domain-containing protein n=1 Tax=Yimella sp. cx-51 TaxID=2770551 RepID=UPI001FCC9E3A|nr:ribonuclease domain-containing protein [Yimella sp. cx-51]
MRDLVSGTRRKASFVGNHFMAICLGLLVMVLALALLTNCNGSSKEITADTPRTYATTSTADSNTTSSGTSSTRAPTSTKADGLRTVALTDLPRQAQATVALIDKGGPYPYPRNDDKTFGNFEGLLPKKQRGYYKEYTVATPGSSSRGARRIVAGEDGTMYYTSDHYKSFRRIVR